MISIDEVTQRALELPLRQRAELAELLIRSLEPPGEQLTEEAYGQLWAAEIKARSDAVHDGTADLIDYDEAMRQLRSRTQDRKGRPS
jgi:putative addiction module component (TIGR02574 family)